jgi:hypothetical protein
MAEPIDYRLNRREPVPLDAFPKSQSRTSRTKTPQEVDEQALSQLESWYCDQVDAHLENRREQLLDCDYYDHEQLDDHTRRVLNERGQAPLQFDLIHPVIDWITGTERRTRVDWHVYPRGPEDNSSAEAKTSMLKFVSDINQAGFERSQTFKDSVKTGVGWMREFAQNDADDVPIAIQRVDWKRVRWDEFSRADDLRDCRSINIDHYTDLDYAIAMFPDKADMLRSASQQFIDPAMEYLENDLLMPQMFRGQRISGGGAMGTALRRGVRRRARIKLVETEYRRVVTEKRVRALSSDYPELSNILWDDTNGELLDLRNRNVITVDDRPVERMWIAVWAPGTKILCLHQQSPYRHNRFSLTPTWCYRRDRDGMPYGVIRGLRDPQDEYNKRRSKALFALSTNRVIYEEDAIAHDVDEEDFLAEVPKPNAQLKVANGALAGNKIKIESGADVAESHIKLMELSENHVFQASGVTRENLGLESGSVSGRAILAKQQQGSVSTAEIFDNYRRGIQTSGEKTLSLCEQYMTQPMFIRVLEQDGLQFIGINQPVIDPATGQVMFQNDIIANQADFVVDQQDYRETVRMAMAEMLMDVISKMPPEIGMHLLDLAVDLTDLPNRNEIVARIRQMTSMAQQSPPPDPNAEANALAEQQTRQAQYELTAARARRDNAQAENLLAKAQHTRVSTKGAALNVAGALQSALPLAPAADRLAEYPPPLGTGTGAGTESLPP